MKDMSQEEICGFGWYLGKSDKNGNCPPFSGVCVSVPKDKFGPSKTQEIDTSKQLGCQQKWIPVNILDTSRKMKKKKKKKQSQVAASEMGNEFYQES